MDVNAMFMQAFIIVKILYSWHVIYIESSLISENAKHYKSHCFILNDLETSM
jgi:hypothetical protein